LTPIFSSCSFLQASIAGLKADTLLLVEARTAKEGTVEDHDDGWRCVGGGKAIPFVAKRKRGRIFFLKKSTAARSTAKPFAVGLSDIFTTK
jgi:hypothetical protein